jgi:hypothetical protein
VPRLGIPTSVDAGRDDDAGTFGATEQEIVAGDHHVASADGGKKTAEAARAVQPSGRVGIPEEESVVEVENEAASVPAEQPALPGGQQLALDDNKIKWPESSGEPEP